MICEPGRDSSEIIPTYDNCCKFSGGYGNKYKSEVIMDKFRKKKLSQNSTIFCQNP